MKIIKIVKIKSGKKVAQKVAKIMFYVIKHMFNEIKIIIKVLQNTKVAKIEKIIKKYSKKSGQKYVLRC